MQISPSRIPQFLQTTPRPADVTNARPGAAASEPDLTDVLDLSGNAKQTSPDLGMAQDLPGQGKTEDEPVIGLCAKCGREHVLEDPDEKKAREAESEAQSGQRVLAEARVTPSADIGGIAAADEAEDTHAAGDGHDHQNAEGTETSADPHQRSATGEQLTEEEKKEVERLEERDREVRTHEQAHVAAGGQHVRGGIKYEYQTGPNGRRYAVGGEVSIDTSPKDTPEKTIQKAQQIRRAALAPAEPSGADRSAAAAAARMEAEARQELVEERTNGSEDGVDESSASSAARPDPTGSQKAQDDPETPSSENTEAANSQPASPHEASVPPIEGVASSVSTDPPSVGDFVPPAPTDPSGLARVAPEDADLAPPDLSDVGESAAAQQIAKLSYQAAVAGPTKAGGLLDLYR